MQVRQQQYLPPRLISYIVDDPRHLWWGLCATNPTVHYGLHHPPIDAILITVQTTHIMNRSELQDKYIHADIDAMDLDDMYTILYDLLEEKVSKLSDEELMEDVKEYHSHLLEE